MARRESGGILLYRPGVGPGLSENGVEAEKSVYPARQDGCMEIILKTKKKSKFFTVASSSRHTSNFVAAALLMLYTANKPEI